eukprot:SAG31_NODE_4853_length_2904_cov_1.876649_3_plen_76_part_00
MSHVPNLLVYGRTKFSTFGQLSKTAVHVPVLVHCVCRQVQLSAVYTYVHVLNFPGTKFSTDMYGRIREMMLYSYY